MMRFIFFLDEPSRYPGTLPAGARSVSPRPPQPESTCYLPRRGICNQSSIRGERRPVPHSSRVGSQITGCSNLNPLNAPQRVSEIWLLVFTVSCVTVNKRAHKKRVNVADQHCDRADRSGRPKPWIICDYAAAYPRKLGGGLILDSAN